MQKGFVMKKLILMVILLIAGKQVWSQDIGFTLNGGPMFVWTKYKTFNTFVDSYNEVNGAELKGFNNPKSAFYKGGDLYFNGLGSGNFGMFIGMGYSNITMSTDPIVINAVTKRHFDLRLRDYLFNAGWIIGAHGSGICPYITIGLNDMDIDAYMMYFDKYKSYGTYGLDGTYSSFNMLFGFGIKANIAISPAYLSIGVSKLYTVMPNPWMWDWESIDKTDHGGWDMIGTDWASYTSNPTYDYTGEYVTPAHKQLLVQLSLGFYLGSD